MYDESVAEITQMLDALGQGKPLDDEVVRRVCKELRQMAAAKMANEAPGHTLQPTALVHEAWLRLGVGQGSQFQNRAHFFASSAEAMRRILVENARRKERLKRGGNLRRVEIDEVDLPSPMPDDELLVLDEALTLLGEIEPRAAELVKLCYFVGLTQEQAAKELGVSLATVERTWAYARAWLFRKVQELQRPSR